MMALVYEDVLCLLDLLEPVPFGIFCCDIEYGGAGRGPTPDTVGAPDPLDCIVFSSMWFIPTICGWGII